MANLERENILGIVDKRRTQALVTGPWETTQANYNDVPALRARLIVLNAGYYTAARLETLTKNDMVYAVRLADDLAGV